jgi:hypothetical protein
MNRPNCKEVKVLKNKVTVSYLGYLSVLDQINGA